MAVPTFVDLTTGGHAVAASSTAVASVPGGTDQYYLVCVATRTYTNTVTSISFGGLSFSSLGSQEAGDGTAGNKQFLLTLLEAWGSPSTGTLTANYSGSPGTVSICVARISGFDQTTPSDGFNSSALADTAAMALTLTSTQNDSLHVVFGSPRSTTLTTNPGDAAYTRRGNSDNGSGGERINLYCETLDKATAGADTWNATGSAANDHAVIGACVRPYVAPATKGFPFTNPRSPMARRLALR